MEFTQKESYTVADLVEIVRLLRAPGGCPWDAKQTHESIRANLIEETYEVAEAIDKKDAVLLKEELGDLLLQVVFHAQMEEDVSSFDFDAVADGICKKLIYRHPHVFADTKVDSVGEVLNNWDELKKKEKGQKTPTETLEAVPNTLPALMRSQKIQHRAAKAGFDYPDAALALDDLKSEVVELEEALVVGTPDSVAEELGDVLFSAVNVSRLLGYDAEEILGLSCKKFIKRFSKVEKLAKIEKVDLKEADLESLDHLWKEAKR